MLETRDGCPYLSGRLWDKKGAGQITIRALDPFYSRLMAKIHARGWREEDGDFVWGKDTTASFRRYAGPQQVGRFLRALPGWSGHKTNHRIRDWLGSQIAMKYGIFGASLFLRHSSVAVTPQHYNSYVTAAATTNKDQILVRYAQPAPIPAIALAQAV